MLQPEPEPAPEPQPVRAPAAEASIADLMRRLEQGWRAAAPTGSSARRQAQAPAPQVFPEANDDRLQSAIESLQRFAARGE